MRLRLPCSGGLRPAGAVLAILAAVSGCAPAHDVETLFKQMQSPDLEARQDAAEQLDRIVRAGDYDVFVRGVQSTNRLYRAQSIVFLAQIPRPEARRALRDLLRVENRSMLPFNPIRLRAAAEETDSRILVANLIAQGGGDAEAVGVLIAGSNDQPADVVAATCFAVGALRDPKGVPFLAAATRSPDLAVVRAAVQALGRYRQPDALEALKGVISHRSEEVRSDVLSSLEMWDDATVVDLFKAMGSSDPSPEIRGAAIQQLGRFKDPTLVPYLIERLRSRDEITKIAALGVLGRMTGQSLGLNADRWARWWAQSTARPARAH